MNIAIVFIICAVLVQGFLGMEITQESPERVKREARRQIMRRIVCFFIGRFFDDVCQSEFKRKTTFRQNKRPIQGIFTSSNSASAESDVDMLNSFLERIAQSPPGRAISQEQGAPTSVEVLRTDFEKPLLLDAQDATSQEQVISSLDVLSPVAEMPRGQLTNSPNEPLPVDDDGDGLVPGSPTPIDALRYNSISQDSNLPPPNQLSNDNEDGLVQRSSPPIDVKTEADLDPVIPPVEDPTSSTDSTSQNANLPSPDSRPNLDEDVIVQRSPYPTSSFQESNPLISIEPEVDLSPIDSSLDGGIPQDPNSSPPRKEPLPIGGIFQAPLYPPPVDQSTHQEALRGPFAKFAAEIADNQIELDSAIEQFVSQTTQIWNNAVSTLPNKSSEEKIVLEKTRQALIDFMREGKSTLIPFSNTQKILSNLLVSSKFKRF